MQTKEEFESAYAERSGLTFQELHEHGGHGEPCDCGEGTCAGWQMVFPNRSADLSTLGNVGIQASQAGTTMRRMLLAAEAEAEKQTLWGASRELGDAWNVLVLEVAYSLGIDRICSWLTRAIRWCQSRLSSGE